MKYTIGTASKATGKSKSTISRDIKSGKISASHKDDGSYEIEPSELHRVYPAISCNSTGNSFIEHSGTHETSNENKAVKAEVDGLHEQIELLKDERNDLRRRLDAESDERRRLTLLITHKPETVQTPVEKAESRLFNKLFGRKL